ncbi:Fungal cellulose binding domain protein [Pseudozyma hubeiensis]|nr:Fungal cellulose binding domain protein [Pseudozyma hubeiensis]
MSFPLLFILVLKWTLTCSAQASEFVLPFEPEHPLPDLQAHINEQAKAEEAAELAEKIFALPRGHLRPVYGYRDNLHDAIAMQFQYPGSRFAVYEREGAGDWFAISPWTIRVEPGAPWLKSILFLDVRRTGEVYPLGHATVKDGVAPGHTENLWKTIQRAARTSQRDLINKFGVTHLLTPVY